MRVARGWLSLSACRNLIFKAYEWAQPLQEQKKTAAVGGPIGLKQREVPILIGLVEVRAAEHKY